VSHVSVLHVLTLRGDRIAAMTRFENNRVPMVRVAPIAPESIAGTTGSEVFANLPFGADLAPRIVARLARM